MLLRVCSTLLAALYSEGEVGILESRSSHLSSIDTAKQRHLPMKRVKAVIAASHPSQVEWRARPVLSLALER